MITGLNPIDIIIIMVFAFSAIVGFSRGFVNEILALATLIAALIIAITFSSALANMFVSTPSVQNVVSQASSTTGVNAATAAYYLAIGISFAILFFGTMLIGWIIRTVLSLAFQTGMLGMGNRLLGGLFGLARGYILTIVLIFVVQATPLSAQAFWQQSSFVKSFQPEVQMLASIVSPALANLQNKASQGIQNASTKLQNAI